MVHARFQVAYVHDEAFESICFVAVLAYIILEHIKRLPTTDKEKFEEAYSLMEFAQHDPFTV